MVIQTFLVDEAGDPDCKHCPYKKKVKVWTSGGKGATVAFVGQCPGPVEAMTGEFFTGPSGIRLNTVIEAVDLVRREVLITNLIKCVLPPKATVNGEAIARCWPLLMSELKDARFIVLIGGHAQKQVRKRYRGNAKLFNLIHPAAALREAIYEARLRKQTKLLKRELRKWRERGRKSSQS